MITLPAVLAALGALVLAGCRGLPTPGERQARHDLGVVAGQYRPGNQRPALPELTPDSSLSNFVAFALLNSPTVEAAFYDWSASVENITVARSLPDPQLTFQMDIANIVSSVMPGLVQQFPGPGKLRAQGGVASAASQSKYFAFESAVLQSAYAMKQAYYRLEFLDEKIRVDRRSLQLLAESERVARAQNAAGRAALSAVYQAQIAEDQWRTDLANLEDSRRPLVAQFKAALGLTPNQPDPPLPEHFESTTLALSPDQLLATAFARNPQLKALAAEVQQAQASLALAYKDKIPDFSLGLMADAAAAPVFYRPLAGMSLPIWRDKISAEIAAEQASQRAAEARLNAAQIQLAVDFAGQSFDYRLALRNLALFQDRVIPQSRRSLTVARAGFQTGTADFARLIDAEQALLNFELSAIEARQQRELALANLSLLIAGVPPTGAPLLPNNQMGSSALTKISK